MISSNLVRNGVLWSALALGLLTPAVAHAQSAEQALAEAPVAVHAVVGASRAAWDPQAGVIVTYVELQVIETLRGQGVPRRLVLKQLGGSVGAVTLWIAGQAEFKTGEQALFYLSPSRRDRTLHTTALARGKVDATADALRAARAASGNRAPVVVAFLAEPPEFAALNGSPAPTFAYLPTGGQPARWHEVDDHVAVFVDHPSALPATWTGGTTANATAAINLWRNSGMDLDLRDGGNTLSPGQCSATFTGNGRIAVSYNDPCGGVSDWSVGGGYYTTGDLRTVNGTEFQKFIQGFVILDSAGPQTSSAGCFQDAVAHGLGHALGLGHTSAGGSMMEAAPRGNCAAGPGGLGADDLAGITSIYRGIPSGPNPPDAPVNFTVAAVLNTVSLAWAPAQTGGLAQRYLVDAGTAPGVYNLGSATFPSSTTSTGVGGVAPGTYYLRVRAQNAIGTSAPSPERSVTVGACAAPGPPGTLSGSAVDTLVNLHWSAPASGVAQGYRMSVGTAPGLANLAVQDFAGTVNSLAGPAPYGTYFVRVQATNACGVSPPGNEITLAVQPCTAAPQAPTGLTSTKNGTILTISWTAPAGTPPTSYTLAVGSAPGLSNLAVLPTGTAATSVAGVAPAGSYYVRVLAQNACGFSGASNEILIVVP